MELKSKEIISDLITVAKADGIVTTQEYDFICTLADRMQMTRKEVDALFKNQIATQTPTSELKRITHFYKLVLVMNVDEVVHEKEVLMLRNFGLKMGIRPGAMDQILLQMDNYENKIIPSEDLIKIFQTYYN